MDDLRTLGLSILFVILMACVCQTTTLILDPAVIDYTGRPSALCFEE